MIAFVDSSVLLRVLLNQANKLKEFSQIERSVASKLLKTECLRTLYRLRHVQLLDEKEYFSALKELYMALDSIELVELTNSVLDRAGGSFALALGTLDAIHLASALAWRDYFHRAPVFLTHDVALAKAALAEGFRVLPEHLE